MKKQRDSAPSDKTPRVGFEGILKGLGALVEKLGDLAETGEKLSKSGEFKVVGPGGKEGKGIYGFSIKMGIADDKVKVEPFGNIRTDKKSGAAVVQEIREPMVDIFEEKDHTLVVAETPGISAGDVHLDVKDDLLTITAEKGKLKYRKEILLPGTYPPQNMQVSCNNGILEIKCTK